MNNNEQKEIWYLRDYNWCKGTLVKENKKTYTIKWINHENYYCPNEVVLQKFPKEKCAFSNELVCIVWESWKGVNGRGGYRVERELYSDKRMTPDKISRQHSSNSGRVTEDSYGIIK